MVQVKVGQTVTFVDPVGKHRAALITAAWSYSCVNMVLVSEESTRTDSYGRQIERVTSISHASTPGRAPGNFWYAGSIDEKVDPEYKPSPTN